MTQPEPQPNPYANPVSTALPLGPAEEKQWAVLTHVLSIFFGVVAAGILYFLYRDRGPFVKAHTTTEWNLQLTVLIVSGIAFLLCMLSILSAIPAQGSGQMPPGVGLFFIGYVLVIVVRLTAAIFGIRAALAANRGQFYRYPIAIPFAR